MCVEAESTPGRGALWFLQVSKDLEPGRLRALGRAGPAAHTGRLSLSGQGAQGQGSTGGAGGMGRSPDTDRTP